MSRFTESERRASIGLAGVFSLRMFGLFVILPVLAVYTAHLPGGNNATMIGVALGIYGLTQAAFQIPFGRLSDFWGRKKTIYLGLGVFIVGSLIAATSDSILQLCIGRAVQGAGAVSAAAMALTSDLTRDSVRTKSMALIGVTIGVTFILSIAIGPLLESLIGVSGIFLLTAMLSCVAVLVVKFYVPDCAPDQNAQDEKPAPVAAVLRDLNLLRLDFGIFSLHGILMAMFVVIPFALLEHADSVKAWQFYLTVMIASIFIMVPLIVISERTRFRKQVFCSSILLIAASQIFLSFFEIGVIGLGVTMILFFGAFNLLEASLPSWVSRVADRKSKGTALGVYSTSQFLGTFIGGVAGGWIYGNFSSSGVFLISGIWALVWMFTMLNMEDDPREAVLEQ